MSNIITINPYTESPISEYEYICERQLEVLNDVAEKSYKDWSQRPLYHRVERIQSIATALENNIEQLSNLISTEMGKPHTQSIAEIKKSKELCAYYVESADEMLKTESCNIPGGRPVNIHYLPLGCILGIMPWNYPVWQVMRFVIPNLLLGNVVFVKHADNVSGVAELLQNIFLESGLPVGVVTNLRISHTLCASLIKDERVKGVSLTGSTNAGKSVAEVCGANMKKSLFELGGSDPYLVLEDADIELAARTCALSRVNNSGQSCISAKRFIIHQGIYDDFMDAVSKIMSAFVLGDPFGSATQVGPLARQDLQQKLISQVERSIAMGAKAVFDIHASHQKGYFVQPNLLENIPVAAPAYKEELFGPVASVYKVKNEQQAIQIANQTGFGLGAAVFSKDVERANHIATHHIESGMVAINDFVRSNPRVPFGGIGLSGYGREMRVEGVREFANQKAIFI